MSYWTQNSLQLQLNSFSNCVCKQNLVPRLLRDAKFMYLGAVQRDLGVWHFDDMGLKEGTALGK